MRASTSVAAREAEPNRGQWALGDDEGELDDDARLGVLVVLVTALRGGVEAVLATRWRGFLDGQGWRHSFVEHSAHARSRAHGRLLGAELRQLHLRAHVCHRVDRQQQVVRLLHHSRRPCASELVGALLLSALPNVAVCSAMRLDGLLIPAS